jgi:hypothetical protein
MTEQEWLSCTDPRSMLEWLRTSGRLSERKARLFAVACCRRIWPRLTDERSRMAVEVAERYADGAATNRELRFAFSCAADAYAFVAASHTADAQAAAGAANTARPEAHYHGSYMTPREEHPKLLRELFGPLPFRKVHIDPPCLTPAVLTLAQAIYEGRQFQDLPILADALEEAGCSDPDILAHCRGPGPHVRGCWLLDLLLGKT